MRARRVDNSVASALETSVVMLRVAESALSGSTAIA